MALYHRFIFQFAIAVFSLTAFAQPGTIAPDRVYGLDPLLFNGRIYAFFPPEGTGGTQFLAEKFDAQGSVTLRGVTYTDLNLNYDIYNQQLVLKYKNTLGSLCLIEISAAWLESFDLGGRHFVLMAGNDTTNNIFQVLGNGPLKILFSRRKELRLDTRTSYRNHIFVDTPREMFVNKAESRVKFSNNRGFCAVFGTAQQELIRKYMRKHKIKVKKASDSLMTDLINYCNSLNGL